VASTYAATARGQATTSDDDLFTRSPEKAAEPRADATRRDATTKVAARLMGERPYKLLYPDRNPKIVTQVKLYSDDSRVYHGPFAEYYRNGKVFCQGEYRDGKRHGPWVFQLPDGKVAKKGEYDNDKPIGKWVLLYPNGLTMREESYKDGLPHGSWVFYGQDGKTPVSQIEFVNGKPVPKESG
jgi:antitoxin component YwqK of YwqJK toxin-antitoxin module